MMAFTLVVVYLHSALLEAEYDTTEGPKEYYSCCQTHAAPSCSSSFPSRRSMSVKASAVDPAYPAKTRPSPSFRTLVALGFTTMSPWLTCPSPIITCRNQMTKLAFGS